ncbi:MAG: YceD family protein [Chloroflexota bacterium]
MSHPSETPLSPEGITEPLHLIDCSPLLAQPSGASAPIPHFSVVSESGGERLSAEAQLRADRTNRGLRIVGSTSGTQEGLCARCLAPARAILQANLDEEIVEDRFATGEGERFGLGNSVDLGRLAIEGLDLVRQLVLHCDPPCPERCERCGGPHAVVDCPEHEIDPRLAVLGRLLQPVDEESSPKE